MPQLTWECFVIMPDGEKKKVSELSDEESKQWHKNIRERLSMEMSRYFSGHPTELQKIPEG